MRVRGRYCLSFRPKDASSRPSQRCFTATQRHTHIHRIMVSQAVTFTYTQTTHQPTANPYTVLSSPRAARCCSTGRPRPSVRWAWSGGGDSESVAVENVYVVLWLWFLLIYVFSLFGEGSFSLLLVLVLRFIFPSNSTRVYRSAPGMPNTCFYLDSGFSGKSTQHR